MIDVPLARLTQRWSSYWPSADHATMAAEVGQRARDAIAAWGLSDLAPLAGGDVALVLAASRGGRPVVLKLHPRGHDEEPFLAAEARALAAWADAGAAVQVLELRDDGLTLLLQRLDPGTPLGESGLPWEEQLKTIGELVARLHTSGASPPEIPTLTDYAGAWRDALASSPAEAAELVRLLDWDAPTLLHADLHPGNVLRHYDRWLAIDPHAAIGDPHADVWALIDPLAPALPEDAAPAVARHAVALYASAAGLDEDRAARWVRIRARAEATDISRRANTAPSSELAWAARLRRFADALA